MEVDELRRRLDDAGRRSSLDLVEARAAVGLRAIRRRRRNRQLVGLAFLALVVAVAVPVVLRDSDPKRRVIVAPSPEGNSGWGVLQKDAVGLGAGSSFAALASSNHSLLLAGARAADNDWQAAIWYSDDGVAWNQAQVPATANGGVNAIATTDGTALAIGSVNQGRSAFVWRSDDRGRTWHGVARGEGIFGSKVAHIGPPYVGQLMYAHRTWIASGGASSGYAGVWTSTNGEQWRQVLDAKPADPGTGAVGVNVVVDATDGHLLAYGGDVVWESSDGTTWGQPVAATAPEPFFLRSVVAPGATLAFGEDRKGEQPTPLLRRADGRQTWFVDPTFLARFPGARVQNVTREGDLWVATGWSDSLNHPDAWVSTDGITWRSMPSALYGPPGGTLSLAASVGNRVVLLGTAPELDRYYTLDASTIADQLAPEKAQDASDRYQCTYGIDEADFSADGLPYVTDAVTNRATAEAALQARERRLYVDHPDVSAITVGPGFRRAWRGENGGPYEIVYVHDYAILLHVATADDCPRGKGFVDRFPGVKIFYTVG
jgi:hypothetical protein